MYTEELGRWSKDLLNLRKIQETLAKMKKCLAALSYYIILYYIILYYII